MSNQDPTSKPRYAFVSLGCPKNLVDSERILGLLHQHGYQLADDPAGTDFVVVNTCGFIQEARDESYATIDEMLHLKRTGRTGGVIVSGCLAERQKAQLLTERPDIDSVVGVFGREQMAEVAAHVVKGSTRQRQVFHPPVAPAFPDIDRLRITPRHFAYLKIAEGCDRLCTFCEIPKLRGKHASKPIEQIVSEARELAADGVRELILVAQDTTYYGIDLYGKPRLRELLVELEQVGVDWIRLMYLYPMYLDDDLIDTIARSSKILSYIDLPLQHIDDSILRRMSRRVSRQETMSLLQRLRTRIPDLVLRTTLMVGFPGETEKAFKKLVRFVEQQRFERLGVFTYSMETNTASAALPGHLPETTKQQRRARLMEAQQRITSAYNQNQIGGTVPVLIDAPVPDHPGAWIGRTRGDAPDIDQLVFVTETGEAALQPGDMTWCEIVAAQQYDLVGAATSTPW
ncbi:MAG: 30S ribosomal protein S12 methylthiotransferase RimO [Planctomycetota bacterium]